MSRCDNISIPLLCVRSVEPPPRVHHANMLRSTSTVLEHSLSGSIATAQGIIVAVGKPLMAKLADVSVPSTVRSKYRSQKNRIGRGETFIAVTILYVVGYVRDSCIQMHRCYANKVSQVIIATSNTVGQIAAGEIFYVCHLPSPSMYC